MAVKTPLKTLVDNPIERLTSGARSAVDLGSRELSQDWSLALSQMLGLDGTRKMTKNDILKPVNEGPVKAGELQEGVEVSFAKDTQEKPTVQIEPPIDYAGEIIHASETIRSKEEGERLRTIEDIKLRIAQEQDLSNAAILEQRVSVQKRKATTYEQAFSEGVLLRIVKTDNAYDIVQAKVEKAGAWRGANVELGPETNPQKIG